VKRSVRNIRWIEEHCRAPEGRLVGQRIKLWPEQRKIMRGIYDSPTRKAIISFGRKNGKTTLCAMLMLLHLVGPEARRNAQLYSSAKSRDQAALTFDLAAKIVRFSATLRDYLTIRDSSKEIYCPELGSKYKALSADVSTNLGKSPTVLIHDELGEVRGPTSELYNALETSFGAQEDPLSIIISTQAPSDTDLLSILIDDAKTGEDPKTKLFFWEAPKEDDPFKVTTWRKANPMLGDVLNIETIRDRAKSAKRMPTEENSFRNRILNQRVNHTSPFIPRAVWEECGGDPDRTVLAAGPVYMGLDLSSCNDLTALAYGAMDKDRVWHVWCEFFAPTKGLVERSKRDNAPYDIWRDKGLIALTPGASVDYEYVAARLVELCREIDVTAISFDRWNMKFLKKELERIKAELPLVEFGQGFQSMSPAAKAVEAALGNGHVRHGNNPVLTWCAANAVSVSDPAGNIKLDKMKSTGRIDGIVAMTMMIGAAALAEVKEKPRVSVYSQGVI
jgi:phage terminase large subunit-like protein